MFHVEHFALRALRRFIDTVLGLRSLLNSHLEGPKWPMFHVEHSACRILVTVNPCSTWNIPAKSL